MLWKSRARYISGISLQLEMQHLEWDISCALMCIIRELQHLDYTADGHNHTSFIISPQTRNGCRPAKRTKHFNGQNLKVLNKHTSLTNRSTKFSTCSSLVYFFHSLYELKPSVRHMTQTHSSAVTGWGSSSREPQPLNTAIKVNYKTCVSRTFVQTKY